MITLIHGDLIEASRSELYRMKSDAKAKDVRELDGKGLDLASLVQALESHSLFGGDTLIIIENLFGKLGKKIKLIETLGTQIVKASDTADIILWEDKEVSPTVIKNLGKITNKVYKTPQILFQFLDGLRPGSAKQSLKLFSTLTDTTVPEIVYVMMVRRVKYLIQLADHQTPEGLLGWQAGRLTAQAQAFTIDKLVSMHTQLLFIDISIKTGRSPFTLAQQLEQFIIHIDR